MNSPFRTVHFFRQIAIDYGYYRYKYLIMVVAVIILILLVQFFQSLGTYLAKKSDKRLK